MADQKLSALTTIPAVDRAADLLYIVDTSAGTSNKVTPNGLLGITGAPVGDTDSATLTNKTITSPNISGPVLSGTVTGTYTIGGTPTFPSSVVTLTGSQTLTNKILTSPTINTPTITNPTLTTDTVSEFTSGNGVNVDGLNIKDSKLNTANSVVTASITDAAVTPAKLVAGTGTGWAWQSWTPTWTNLTVASSTVTAKYVQIGKTVFYRVCVVLGGGNVPSGSVSFTLPVTSVVYAGTSTLPHIGDATYYITNGYSGAVVWTNTTTASFRVDSVGASYATDTTISATVPNTFANGSEIIGQGFYEAA